MTNYRTGQQRKDQWLNKLPNAFHMFPARKTKMMRKIYRIIRVGRRDNMDRHKHHFHNAKNNRPTFFHQF